MDGSWISHQKLTGIWAKLGQHFFIFAAILLLKLGLEKRFHHFFHLITMLHGFLIPLCMQLICFGFATDEPPLTLDDECDSENCALNALQLQSRANSEELAEDLVNSSETWGSCARYGCGGYSRYRSCQCNSKCHGYRNCCSDYDARCHAPPPPSRSAASCSAFASCHGLHGDCCPTANGMYLGCCPEKMIPHATAPPATSEYGRQVMTLYHQTSPEACHSILRTGFRPGHDGWCGGGIYFALSPQATKTKAITPHSGIGCMLQVKVDVGRVKKFPCCRYCGGRQDEHVPWSNQKLKASGHDSIEINPGDGPEIVIYDKHQVLSIKEIRFDPAWTPHRMHW